MSALRYGPRRVVLPTPHPELAATLRTAGHHVDELNVEEWDDATADAFNRAEVVVIVAPSTPPDAFVGGAAWAQGRLVVVLHLDKHRDPLCFVAWRCVDAVGDVLDLLARWDPVAKTLSGPRRSS